MKTGRSCFYRVFVGFPALRPTGPKFFTWRNFFSNWCCKRRPPGRARFADDELRATFDLTAANRDGEPNRARISAACLNSSREKYATMNTTAELILHNEPAAACELECPIE